MADREKVEAAGVKVAEALEHVWNAKDGDSTSAGFFKDAAREKLGGAIADLIEAARGGK